MSTAAVVLAAGKGTRFRSDQAKVLHALAGRAMVRWVLEALRPLGLDRVVVVVGHQADQVAAEAQGTDLAGLVTVVQQQQRGTGHAVRVAADAGALDGCDTVVVLPGDVPLLTHEPLAALIEAHRGAATLLTAVTDDPAGYGRVLRDASGAVVGIVEERDASGAQRAIRECNTSIYAFAREPLVRALAGLRTDNEQGEEYLTDVVAPLSAAGVDALAVDGVQVAGVNDRVQLAAAAAILRQRILDGLMLSGVSVVDPATTYAGADVRVARDAVLLPGTHLEGSTTVGAGAVVGPDCRLVDAHVGQRASVTYSVVLDSTVGADATVGPYVYLRSGARLERGAKAGTFVEMKNTTVGEGAKVPHLSYMGDATIGRDANVGAACITGNWDGFDKHPTVIGEGARLGSDTILVAPVTIGAQAYTGAGSVITSDVPDGALAVERSEQRVVEGYARRKRDRYDQSRED